MPQLTIYLPAEVERKARKASEAASMSVSKWIAERVTRDLDDGWPASVIAAAGALPGFPSAAEIRKGLGEDSRRESLR